MSISKREEILSCLGDFPKTCELNLSIDSSEDKGDYYLKLISYDVEPSERVESYLLVPQKIKGKLPAILAIHQHAGQWHIGKSEVVGLAGNKIYHYGLELVKRGYIVLAPDLLCFEDRMSDYFCKDREAHGFYERFMFCKYINEGSCLQTKYLHDLSVAVEVLCSLDYVDNDKIGTIGHSLGGQEAAWIMWYDGRLKFGVASCGVGTMKSMFNNNVLHNFALYVPGLSKVCDIDEIIKSISPRSFLMTNGSEDKYFPVDGVNKIAQEAKKRYKELNCEDKFESLVFNGGHLFEDNTKNVVYNWIEKQKDSIT